MLGLPPTVRPLPVLALPVFMLALVACSDGPSVVEPDYEPKTSDGAVARPPTDGEPTGDDRADGGTPGEDRGPMDDGSGDDDAGAGDDDAGAEDPGVPDAAVSHPMGFFVTSATSPTGDLGGLTGADTTCQELAEAVGAGDRKWRAYLSVERALDNSGNPGHARNRIGVGPWYNALGVLVASNLEALHARTGDPDVFVDERGRRINGQWEGSPAPNEHDILTGSDADGRLIEGTTCADWSSSSGERRAQVGHSDGLGPNQNPDPPYSSWQSAHLNDSCGDTAPFGGAGRFYCFAAD